MAVDIVGDGFPLSAKGSIVTHDGSTPAIITPGTDGQILTAQSTASYGLVWSTPDTSAAGESFYTIAASVLTADTASITFSSITSGYTDLHLRGFCKTDATSDGIEVHIQVNNITSGYYTSCISSTGSAVSSTFSTSTSAGAIGIALGSAPTDWSCFTSDILSYSDTSNTYKTGSYYGGYDKSTAGIARLGGWSVSLTSAIDTVKIFPNNSKNFLSGTMISLYGRKK